ncbi:phosphoribosylanthranilate isomerase [Clostridium sp. 1001271B_151109_B4]|uniref:phosphoribosylanthranilate isomerase n=1 Tax=Clostridium sp. 1001271B_151109_B4 TaxID=2787148 RepID=UPI0018A8C469|nr:phosphoribosylanthranilate isomerase [Clostridium sp. 1001271B_151109_B4]
MSKVKIKFCGLFREKDIEYVNKLNPDYIGLVFAKSKRQVSIKQAIKLKSKLNTNIKAVGVFVNEDIEKVLKILDKNIIDIVQLHGIESEDYIKTIKERSTKEVIKAIKVSCFEDIEVWKDSCADYLLLDSGQGTGRTFNWDNIQGLNRPFFLAGGLNLENINEAILKIKPMAIDISSGIETNGVKDFEKMKEVIKIVGR